MSSSLIGSDIFIWLGVAAGLYVAAGKMTRQGVANAPLPPGPKGWPLIGNLLEVPSTEPWKGYAELGEKWGESFTIVSETILVDQAIRLVHQVESCPSTYSANV